MHFSCEAKNCVSYLLASFIKFSKEFQFYNGFAWLFIWFLIILYSSFETALHRTKSTASVIVLTDAVDLLGTWRIKLIFWVTFLLYLSLGPTSIKIKWATSVPIHKLQIDGIIFVLHFLSTGIMSLSPLWFCCFLFSVFLLLDSLFCLRPFIFFKFGVKMTCM